MDKYSYLDALEARSIYIIREAYWEHRNRLSVLWSMGKDSTTLVHLIRKAFLGNVPIPTVHIDTTFKFKQIYKFRDKYAKKWKIPLVIAKNETAIRKGVSPDTGRFACCNALKTEGLKQVVEAGKFNAFLVAIRRDEHAIRAKERYFSLRDKEFKWNYQNQPLELWAEYHQVNAEEGSHYRIHPLLHWREVDVWRYIKREKIPVIDLYFAKNGKRYRSIGCECCCRPVDSNASSIDSIVKEIESTKIAERSGRAQDKEKEFMMQKLRSLGYM